MAEPKRIAVFIDAENIAANHADALFAEIAKRGEISFCRAYGDFTAERMKAWKSEIDAREIKKFQQDSVSNFKNAADIALVIGAMDILHWKRAEHFFIVSDDGDFTPLAKRIKASKYEVIGFGTAIASKSFRAACSAFIELNPPEATPAQTKSNEICVSQKPIKQDRPKTVISQFVEKFAPKDTVLAKPKPNTRNEPPSKAVPLVNTAMKKLEPKNGSFRLGVLCAELVANTPGFTPRKYGCANFSELLEKSGQFIVTRQAGEISIKRKNQNGSKPK